MKARGWRGALAAMLLAGSGCAFAAEPAAEVVMLTGHGSAVAADGTVRSLAKGDKVYSGEMVNSELNSYLNLKFTDGGMTLLRPNTRFQIENYNYSTKAAAPKSASSATATAPATSADVSTESRAFFRLLRGGFRAVSGLIGKADVAQYRVSTPTATIGIRGTDYWVVYCQAECFSTTPGDTLPKTTLVGVIKDGVFVANAAGQQVEVGQDEYLSVLPNGDLVRLPFEPRFLKIDPIPNPQSCQ